MTVDDPYRKKSDISLSVKDMTSTVQEQGEAAYEIELPTDLKLALGKEIKPLNDLTVSVTEIPADKNQFNFEGINLVSKNFGTFKFSGKDEQLGNVIGKSVWSWKNTKGDLTLVISLTHTISEDESLTFYLEAILEDGVMTELTTNSKGQRDYKTSNTKG